MPVFVVDTNVAIVANGRNTHADMACQLSCVEEIESVRQYGIVALDEAGEIMEEYGKHLNFYGMPGVGDMFFKYLFDNQYGGNRVRRVSVTPCSDRRRGFAELPQNGLDPSDRKFLAVAVVAGAAIVNATDSDWSEQQALMDGLGVKVEQLCPAYARK